MAVLQKIRNKGVLLVSIIALALFLFVIGDLLRGGEVLFTQGKQKAGEVQGNSISIQDYQKYLGQYQFYFEQNNQRNQMPDEQLNDIAWGNYVQNQIIKHECEELGLAVSDDEILEYLRTGQHQLLQIPAFMNPATGAYDFNTVQEALEKSKELSDYYTFVQEEMRSALLNSKFRTLLQKSFLSNPVEAQKAFNDRTEESTISLVSIPFSTVADADVKVEDSDLKAKYEEYKNRLVQPVETRDIKYIDIAIIASDADRDALQKEMEDLSIALSEANTTKEISAVVRKSNTSSVYSDVLKLKDAFPVFVQNRLGGDSLSVAVGATMPTTFDIVSNNFYTFKVIEKATQVDSVLFRAVQIIGRDDKDVARRADSVVNAIKDGADFKEVAKKFNQPSDSAWIATAQYQHGQLNADNTTMIKTLYSMSAGEVKKVKYSNGATLVYQVLETRNPVTKYNVAVIERELIYSSKTAEDEYNRLNKFLATNYTLALIEQNAAKEGYTLNEATIESSMHRINNISKTNEDVRWIFDTAKKGEVSAQHRCGESNHEHLLVVALSEINEPGYVAFEKIKEQLRPLALNDKKAEKLLAQCKGITTIAAASKIKGALVDSTIAHVTFSANTFIPSFPGQSEPVIGAIASRTAKGAFAGAFKGNSGVYMLQVTDKTKNAEKFDVKSEQNVLSNTYASYSLNSLFNNYTGTLNILSDLYRQAKVEDLRYKFY